MPLYEASRFIRRALTDAERHLLGKKSWNVYNADNIARVRRDEAAAKADRKSVV